MRSSSFEFNLISNLPSSENIYHWQREKAFFACKIKTQINEGGYNYYRNTIIPTKQKPQKKFKIKNT